MVKDIKYIIKRILIGVGVVLVLSFLRGNLLITAKALEPINVTPNGMCWFSNNVAPDGCYLTPTQFQISWTYFYGNQFGADGGVERFWWRYHGSNIGGKYYNIDLLFYNGDNSSYLDSNRGYIQNSANNIFSCRIDNTRWGITDSISSGAPAIGTATVHCDNVYLTDDYFTFTFVDGAKSYQSIYAVTDATLTPSSDQTILDNQNENTEKEIESQKVCKNDSFSFNSERFNSSSSDISGYLISNGNINYNVNWKVSDYFKLSANNSYVLSGTNTWFNNPYYCIYDENKTLENCISYSSNNLNFSLSFSSNKYIRISYSKESNFNLTLSGYFCINGNQAIADSQQELNNTLNDDTGGEVSSSWFDDFRSNSSSPVSDLLTMPITLMEAYLDGFSGTCQSMNLGRLYGTYIIIPCLNLQSYLGADLWSLIDVLFSMFMVYNIGMLCVSIYEGITGLQDDMQFLYSPRHAGAGDTRVERYGDDY